jgi:hypothetical protein
MIHMPVEGTLNLRRNGKVHVCQPHGKDIFGIPRPLVEERRIAAGEGQLWGDMPDPVVERPACSLQVVSKPQVFKK